MNLTPEQKHNEIREGMKKCADCKTIKSRDEFWSDAARHDGINSICKTCARERQKKNSKRHLHTNNVARWMIRNKLKVKAHNVVGRLIKNGKLVKMPCFLCDAPKTQGHHPNYDFPDKVIWLCASHHKSVHREI